MTARRAAADMRGAITAARWLAARGCTIWWRDPGYMSLWTNAQRELVMSANRRGDVPMVPLALYPLNVGALPRAKAITYPARRP